MWVDWLLNWQDFCVCSCCVYATPHLLGLGGIVWVSDSRCLSFCFNNYCLDEYSACCCPIELVEICVCVQRSVLRNHVTDVVQSSWLLWFHSFLLGCIDVCGIGVCVWQRVLMTQSVWMSVWLKDLHNLINIVESDCRGFVSASACAVSLKYLLRCISIMQKNCFSWTIVDKNRWLQTKWGSPSM